MKRKLFLVLSLITAVFVVVACGQTTTPVDMTPVISGAVDRTIERGSTFVPLQGITATDYEGNDITADIVYSGNVNPNVAGTYQANYTVTDDDGNTKTVTVTITVEIIDTEAPLISGAADRTIFIGDPTFQVLDGVSAVDTIDGDLTDQINVEGTVNIWVPGEYIVTYTVEDTSSNVAERERKITVSLGDFVFTDINLLSNGDFASDTTGWDITNATAVADQGLQLTLTGDAVLSQAGISGGTINLEVANFGLVMLVINAKADAERTIEVSLSGATGSTASMTLTTEVTEFVKYFRFSEALDAETLTIALGDAGTIDIESIQLIVGLAEDTEAPVISVPATDVVAPVDNIAALRSLVLRGVSSQDNIDGNITAGLQLDLSEIDITVPGTVQVPIISVDNAGNEARVYRTVHLNLAFDTSVINDPTFEGPLDETQWGLSGGSDSVTLYTEDGQMVVDIGSPGGWDSATSPFLRNVTTTDLQPGSWYMFQFDVRAEKNRQLRMRAGLELWSDPWIEDFQDGAVRNLQYQITTEWRTIYYVFYIDSATSSAGSSVVKFEIKVGTITWGSEESNNKVFIDNAQFYLLSMQDEPPVITEVPNKQTSFELGSTLPDFTDYVTIYDAEDGAITVTEAMIDASAVDVNTVGTYDVVVTVTDSAGNEVSHIIPITILAEEDTTPPVLTVDEALPIEFDQYEDVTVNLADYVTAIDNIDGEITITNAMISTGGFTLNQAGVYVVTYTVIDSSLNEATITITFTVNDKQAPTITGAADQTLTFGQTFNPLTGVTVTDNVDGAIPLTIEHVSGHEAFLNESFEIIAAGSFEVTYTVSDSAGNEATLTITITVVNIEFDENNATDLLGLEIPVQNDGGDIESLGEYQADGSLIVTYNGVKGWYGSYSKITYTPIELEQGLTYKLVIEAKADVARDILVRFVGSNGEPITAFTGRLIVGLEEDFAVYELIFTVDQPGPYDIQLQFGWEGNLNNASNSNIITINSFQLLPESTIEFDEANATDLLAQEVTVSNDGGVESSGEYQADGSLIVTYNGVQGWYASYSKLVYYQSLQEGQTYKLLLDIEAEAARDILIRFVDSAGIAIDEFEGRYTVSIGTESTLVEIVFVAPATGEYNLQLQFGWEDYLNNSSAANVITINAFQIIPAK